MKNYIKWNFDNSYSKLPKAFKEIIKPVSVLKPELVILNENLAKELGLDFSKIEKNELSALFAGNILPEGTSSIAQAYAGHQFGHFTMLGDGRAVLIGEHVTNQKKDTIFNSKDLVGLHFQEVVMVVQLWVQCSESIL